MLRNRRVLGSALLSALLIMALIAMSVTASMLRLSFEIARTDRFIRHDRLLLATEGVALWAREQLKDPAIQPILQSPQGTVFHFPQKWTTLYPGVQLSGAIYDLQAKFNLNNLSDPAYVEPFTQMVRSLDPSVNANLVKMITAATENWIRPETSMIQDTWTSYYASLRPPYQTAHMFLMSVSEFQFIAGVTPAFYQSLEPYLSTLPEITPINVNTASPLLLKTFFQQASNVEIDEFVLNRQTNPILTQDSFNQLIKKFNLQPGQSTFKSTYFLCVAHATQGKQTLTVFTTFKRHPTNNHIHRVSMIKKEVVNSLGHL